MEKATYSPEDNKIRLYPSGRLPAELYARVKAAGFSWAPKQEIFVAPMWTPNRADLAEELAGELGDEDTSLAERAEIRAERFEEYHEKRAADSKRYAAAVADAPAVIGHHSERQARKQAEKIDQNMARAVQMWETAEYWTRRAAGALRHAKHGERADVRARRIKKIETDQRKQQRALEESALMLAMWRKIDQPDSLKRKDGAPTTIEERAKYLAGIDRGLPYGFWSKLDAGELNGANAQAAAIAKHESAAAWCTRWITHYTNRLAYERAMLGEQGAAHLLEKPKRPAPPPLLNCRTPGGVEFPRMYSRNETEFLPQVEMTKTEYAAIYEDYRGVRLTCAGYRARIIYDPKTHKNSAVFLTDSKEHPRPEAVPTPAPAPIEPPALARREVPAPSEAAQNIAAMRARLAGGGVQVVIAPQLFPTPLDLAQRMADLADIQPGARILEPSAGTGRLLGAMGGRMFGHNPECGTVHAVEINQALAGRLQAEFPLTTVHCADFLDYQPDDFEPFDRIVMNPPFKDGVDIKHIEHARRFLKPGGLLVALCANGSRQRERLQPIASSWEDLPPGTFSEAGTGVNVALLTIEG